MTRKSKKYKYLNYVPAPVNLDHGLYDLVNDEDFCKPDGRIPLLIVTQYGIFPVGHYPVGRDYRNLLGLENQMVAFIRRGYLSNREYPGILEIFLDPDTLLNIRNGSMAIDYSLWTNNESTDLKES